MKLLSWYTAIYHIGMIKRALTFPSSLPPYLPPVRSRCGTTTPPNLRKHKMRFNFGMADLDDSTVPMFWVDFVWAALAF